jgi:hypothetical protein
MNGLADQVFCASCSDFVHFLHHVLTVCLNILYLLKWCKNGYPIFFDLIIYHQRSLSGPRMKYVGGDVKTVEGQNVDRMCFWDLTNVLELYLGYKYQDIPRLYYKYYEESNDEIYGLNKDQEFLTMIRGLINGGGRKLDVIVDHEPDEPVEPIPIKVVQPMLLLSQSHSEVDINCYEEDASQQPEVQPPQQ